MTAPDGTAWIDGAVDLHVHAAPDITPRSHTDLDLARDAVDAGMRAVVVKNNLLPTAGRVANANEAVDRAVLVGSIALNGSVGGVNPAAVEAALAMGARVVWLPTVHSARNVREAQETVARGEPHTRAPSVPTAADVEPIQDGGEVTPRVREVIDLVAAHDAVLATGHLDAADTTAVVEACADAGATCLVTHAFARYLDAPVAVHERLADAGAVVEYCAFTTQQEAAVTPKTVADAVARIGPERCVLSTDYGQVDNPPVAGLAAFANDVHEAGLAEHAVRQAIVDTPKWVLGLD